jgi:hypothetical protein
MVSVKRGTIIVGIDRSGAVLALPEDYAYELALVNRALRDSMTWGDFWRLLPASSRERVFQRMRSNADAFEQSMPSDFDEFDPMTIPGYGDGDWPQEPTSDMLSWLPDNIRAMGTVGSSMLHGELIEIHASRIDDVIVALEAAGYRVIRSDGAVDE